MKKLVSIFLISALGFSSISEASRPSFDEALIDAELRVKYFERVTTVIVPEMMGGETMGVGIYAQRIELVKGGYQIKARVQMCQTVSPDDFTVSIREENGVNQISLRSQKVFVDCDGPLRDQTVVLEYTGDIDYDLSLIQVSPHS